MNKQVNRPLVSIITPTYNHEKYIEQCIESVLAQTYTNWEQIIIDDGSTDLTPQIVSKYSFDERIRYVQQEHIGIWKLSQTYNKALSLARGELIAILEGDDFWPPDKLMKQVVAFDDPDVVITWGIAVYVNDEGKPVGKSRIPRFTCLQGRDMLKKLLISNLIPSVTAVIRKSALFPKGFIQPKGAPYVDYPTWFELTKKGKFCFINEVLGYYRVHFAQMSQRLWAMERGELATYQMLYNAGLISWPTFIGLSTFSLAKYARRVVLSRLRYFWT